MLIRFTVSNFLSFKDETEFNMLTGDVKRHPHHVYKREHIDVLRAAAIYGANGAGKSNLIKAISMLIDIVNGYNEVLDYHQKFKLSKENLSKPTHLEIEFEINNISYAYGLEFYSDRISEEWFYKLGFEKDDEIIFERKTDENHKHKLILADKYLLNERDKFFVEFYEEELIKSKEAFVSLSQAERIIDISYLQDWFNENIHIININDKDLNLVGSLARSTEFCFWFNSIIKSINVGIEEVTVRNFNPNQTDEHFTEFKKDIEQKLRDNPDSFRNIALGENNENSYAVAILENDEVVFKTFTTEHKGNDGILIPFLPQEESDGTKKLFELIPIMGEIEEVEHTYLIDEIDRSIHPALLKIFMKKLMEMTNSKGQIIFTTHESNLLDLDIFRQDEIWFAEKNKEGATEFYPLSDFKPRYDLDIRKGYLNGRFGAIPFLGDLEKLNWNNHAETK
jgi:uncharacterized protein